MGGAPPLRCCTNPSPHPNPNPHPNQVRRPSEVQQLLRRGSAVRATGATRANEASSRSHAVFIIVLEQSEEVTDRHSNQGPTRSVRIG